jgi:hypothetical protein
MKDKKIKTLAEWLEKIDSGDETSKSLAESSPEDAAELLELVGMAEAVRAATHPAPTAAANPQGLLPDWSIRFR